MPWRQPSICQKDWIIRYLSACFRQRNHYKIHSNSKCTYSTDYAVLQTKAHFSNFFLLYAIDLLCYQTSDGMKILILFFRRNDEMMINMKMQVKSGNGRGDKPHSLSISWAARYFFFIELVYLYPWSISQ